MEHEEPEAVDTIVVGLGNPILGDDGVGWQVADLVESAVPAGVVVERLAVGGLALMERLAGFRHGVIVDAIVTGGDAPGTVRVLGLAELPGGSPGHVDNAHDVSLRDALAAGRALGASLPEDGAISIVAIEATRVDVFGEGLSEPVAAAVPRAVEATLALVLGAHRLVPATPPDPSSPSNLRDQPSRPISG